MSGENVSAIILAAGKSRRMGQNKLLLDYRGKPVLLHVLELIASIRFKRHVLVTTRETADAVEIPKGFTVVLNEDPESGQALSVRMGVEAAARGYYMFLAGDMPLLERACIERLLSEAQKDRIVVPVAGGKPLGPCIFPENLRGELLSLNGDSGGRTVRDAHPESCKYVEFQNPRAFFDVDTPEDYAALTGEI